MNLILGLINSTNVANDELKNSENLDFWALNSMKWDSFLNYITIYSTNAILENQFFKYLIISSNDMAFLVVL